MMPGNYEKGPVLVNPAVLERLREELDDDYTIWPVFVRNFISLLPTRLEKLRLTLTTGDLRGTLDAARSIRISGQMLGAERLADLALNLERSLREDPAQADPARILPQLATHFLNPMRACALQTEFRLHQHLQHGRDAQLGISGKRIEGGA
nr:Hpt domain-containing protein [Pseudarthrobacter psychrotolerans]